MEMLWTLIDLVQTTRQFARHATGHHSLLSSLSNAKCVFVTFFLAISMIHHQIVCGYDTFEIYVKNPKHLISQLISAAIGMEQALSILLPGPLFKGEILATKPKCKRPTGYHATKDRPALDSCLILWLKQTHATESLHGV